MSHIVRALPFWMSLLLVPVVVFAAMRGGWSVLLVPAVAWWLFTLIDSFAGLNEANADPDTPDAQLFWYRAVTVLWFPVQAALTFGLIWYVTGNPAFGAWEKIGIFFGVGVLSGTIGVNYAHELCHQKARWERRLGDLLLAMVFYSHFRSEHLLVHHPYVGTPRDPVTARYNEGFHRYYPRVLRQSLVSAFRAEAARQTRRGRPWYHRSNPFWLYWSLQAAFLLLAFALGGIEGVGLLLMQAGVAIWQLELTNYVEHYGLTREYLGDGRYEHVKPRHSWNASHRWSNWLLINLQRHSDHHYKPDRRFPLLQAHAADEAPQLPAGYPAMTFVAMIPPVWRRIMNKRVRAWRKAFYPQIEDWAPYSKATNPMPR
ncbi:alkane 1-monooxygenase [Palleronia sediminis]|uniref:Alkane 1-monooxygenase n=1 Tax=Palleronia sediminis TaxID=2547833 RepID=A0A4R6A3K9_9RHOB|nr:alkane 1-monooxygenase [Palleronia sediminis]TDL78221.1 alkane 1-monooxygenase [Palleronia sediminis]